MRISITEHGAVTVLGVTGRMDATTVGEFEEACLPYAKTAGAKIVVELLGLEYISSAGLRGILTMQKAANTAKASLAFCSLQPMVVEVFKISGFTTILAIHATLEEALGALS